MPPRRCKIPSPPRWRRRPSARASEILEAALVVFGETGFAAARLADVARLAGVSKGTLYLYFDSKEELFREVIRSGAATAFGAEGASSSAPWVTARERLEHFLRTVWSGLTRPEMARITRLAHTEWASFPDLARLYFDAVVRRIHAGLEGVLDDGRRRGEFRSVAHDFDLHAIPSLLLHQALLRDGLGESSGALTDDQLIEGSLDLLLKGLLIRRPDSPAEAR